MLQIRKIFKSKYTKQFFSIALSFSLVLGGVLLISPNFAYADTQSDILAQLKLIANFMNSSYGSSTSNTNNWLYQSYQYLGNIQSDTANQLVYIRNASSGITNLNTKITESNNNLGAISSYNSSISSNTADIKTLLSLDWLENKNSSGTVRTVYKGTSTTLNGSYDTTSKTSDNIYVKFNMGYALSSLVVRIDLWNLFRYSGYTTHDFELFYDDNGTFKPIPITTYYNNGYLYTGVFPEGFKSGDIIMHISINHSYAWRSATSIDVSYLSNDYLSTWVAKDTISTMSIEKMLYDLHSQSYDPNAVQAKEESQPVINQMLDDFSGDGSASTKVSDVVSAKDTSGALKNGLSTGGSSSDTFTVFSPSSDFFKWFSQENSDYINGDADLPVRGRSGFFAPHGETYPDYQYIDDEYWEVINSYGSASD